jgi:hypothetical protein
LNTSSRIDGGICPAVEGDGGGCPCRSGAAETQRRVRPDGRFVAATPRFNEVTAALNAAGVLAFPYIASASTAKEESLSLRWELKTGNWSS